MSSHLLPQSLVGTELSSSEIENLLVEFEGLYFGIGFKQIDKNAAQQLMKKACDLGSRYAAAWCIMWGWKGEENHESGAALFRELAEYGDERAHFMLGECLYWGLGVTQDQAEAVSWFRRSQHIVARCQLARCYYEGRGVTQDFTKAVQYWREAAEQGHADAQRDLGKCYERGQGVTQDYNEALKWYRNAQWSYPQWFFASLILCLRDAAKALLDTGDRIESAELLWEAIGVAHANHETDLLKDITRDFWTRTLPPLRLIAARAVFLAGESAGLHIYHKGIRDEAWLAGKSLKWAGLPYGPIDPVTKQQRVGKRELTA